jgi:hypothetical protein
MTLVETIRKHLAMLPGHVRERETALLLRAAVEEMERPRGIPLDDLLGALDRLDTVQVACIGNRCNAVLAHRKTLAESGDIHLPEVTAPVPCPICPLLAEHGIAEPHWMHDPAREKGEQP